jgi:serine protease Do
MNRTRPLVLLAIGAAMGIAAAAMPDLVAPPAQAQELWTKRPGPAFDQDRPLSFGHFRDMAKALSPAVVNVQVSKSVGSGGGRSPFDFFIPERSRQQHGQGTGFIIHKDGLILTNNHVVEGADQVTVTLLDEREFSARVVGSDPATDLALIQIDAEGLTVAPLGDSSKLEVGEWVMAIGNPFGLTHTVTTGIVSAKGRRNVKPDSRLRYRDFIQTDASINPGNSGGPLINVSGEVVGINSAIFGRQSVGVGFAIPVNIAKELIPALRKHGRPQRSWIGIGIQDVTPELARAFGLKSARGALVNHVQRNGPGWDAGLRRGDVIVEFNAQPIKSADDLPWLASTAGIGARVPAVVVREGARKKFTILLSELPSRFASDRPRETRGAPPASSSSGELGLTISPLPAEIVRAYDLSRGTTGVLVTGVDHGSPAHRAGLREGDVIVQLQSKPVRDMAGFAKRIRRVKRGRALRMLVRREGGASEFMAMKKP